MGQDGVTGICSQVSRCKGNEAEENEGTRRDGVELIDLTIT